MKNLDYLNQYRIPLYGYMGDSFNGCFNLRIGGEKYYAIASIGGGWDHVSISHDRKIPSWKTMCQLKKLFFNDDEAVIQIHPAKKNYVNNCATCLHLWRNHGGTELPPLYMV